MAENKVQNIIKYVAPAVLSQVCFFLFTIFDGIFVGNGVNTEALAAVNMAFPFVMVANALFSLVSIGGVAISAIKLGQQDNKGANSIFRHATMMLGIISVILCVIGVFFTDWLCNILGANDTYYHYLHDYIFWYSVFIIPSGISMLLQFFGRNDGIPGLVGLATIISIGCDLILDWLFIFPMEMGIVGAAISTGIGQIVALLILLMHFVLKKGVFTFGLPKYDRKTITEILANGLPAGIGQLSPAIMTLCMNLVLISKIGDIGVNAFSVISYVSSFTVAVFNGTSEGLQPLFGQTYGAENKKDLRFYFKSGIWINFIGSIVILSLILMLTKPICALFGVTGETLNYVIQVMPLYAWAFIVMAFNMIIVSYLYSTDKAKEATIISILRGIVFSIAVIFIVPAIFGSTSVWLTMGIYEALALIVALTILKTTCN